MGEEYWEWGERKEGRPFLEFKNFPACFIFHIVLFASFMSQPAERALSQLKPDKESNKEPVLQMTHSQHASANCVILRKGSEKQTAGQETLFIDMLISSSESPKTHPGASEITKNFRGLYPRSPLKGDGRGASGVGGREGRKSLREFASTRIVVVL